MVQEINKKEDFDSIIKEGITFVDMYAPWCGPCKMVAPIIDEMANDITDVRFVKVNVDENREIAMQYGIRSIPTFIVFKNGVEATRSVGIKNKNFYVELINEAR